MQIHTEAMMTVKQLKTKRTRLFQELGSQVKFIVEENQLKAVLLGPELYQKMEKHLHRHLVSGETKQEETPIQQL